MKKITLFLGAMLVSLSVLAAPIVKVQSDAVRLHTAKQQLAKQEVKMVSQNAEKTIPATAFKAADKAAFDLNKVVKQDQAAKSVITMEEEGYGNAKATITPAEGSDTLYYQVAILDEAGKTVLAYVGYFPMATVTEYFVTTYDIIYTAATQPKYGKLDPSIKSLYLPKGKYIYGILGYAVEGGELAENPSDYAYAPFEIKMDGSEYAIKNLSVTVGEDNALTAVWETNTTPVPEGATYQVRVYDYLADTVVVNSGSKLTATTWTTPDTITIPDNTTYEVYVNIRTASGYALGKAASKIITVGTDPNAPTDLAVNVDKQTMKATFTWKNSITSYSGKTVYNQVHIEDEDGNVYIFDNGYDNTSKETGTSETLPVGKFTWTITPFYVNEDDDWIYITYVEGPAFEVKDEIAPVINSVAIAQTSDTEVYLSIDATDNALGVTAADLKYNVSGDITLENATLEEDGTLKLAELVSTKTYSISIIAVDPSGNKSQAYPFEFTPVKDEEAPTNLTAEIKEGDIHERSVIITVSAQDDKATAEQLVYVLTFADETVLEKNAVNGQLVIEGLQPETEYAVTIAVKDLGGNVCENTVALTFTTLPLTPIAITGLNAFQGKFYSKYNAYELLVYDADEETSAMLDLVFYTRSETKVANVYTPTSSTAKLSLIVYIKEDGSEVEITADKLTLKFIDSFVDQGVQISYYYFEFEGMGDDGNLYVYSSINYGLFYKDTWQNWVTVTDTFVDDDAPEIWVSEDYPVEVDGTNVEIMFGAIDGPWYFDEEIYTDTMDLVLEIQTEEGTVLASHEAGTIGNTPTLDDEYGEYYFTAYLKDLEPETDYTVYIYAKDKAGNEAEKIEVTFTTGEQSQGIEQVNSNLKVQKFIRDGQVIIKRGDKEFNVIGTEL